MQMVHSAPGRMMFILPNAVVAGAFACNGWLGNLLCPLRKALRKAGARQAPKE